MAGNPFDQSARAEIDLLYSTFRDLELDENLITEMLAPIARAPESEEPWAEAATRLRRRGYPRAAARLYEVALQRFPESWRLWGNRGVLERNRGNHEEAIQSLSRAMALKPDYGIAIHNLANAYELHGDFSSAFDWYAKAIVSDGPKAASWNGLGNCHGAVAQYDRAIDCYRRAIELDPDYDEPYFNWALQLVRAGRRAEAIERLAVMVRKWPGDGQAQSLLTKLQDETQTAPNVHNAQPPTSDHWVVRALDDAANRRTDSSAAALPVGEAKLVLSFDDLAKMTPEEAAAAGAGAAYARVQLWRLIDEAIAKGNPPEHPRLFLSYRRESPEHLAWLRRLAHSLDQRGYDVMLDQFIQNQEKAPSVPELVALIATCNIFVPVLTDGYFERIKLGDGPVVGHSYLSDGWVWDEFEAALRLGRMKRLVVTGLWRSGEPQQPFNTENAVDMRDDDRFEEVLSGPFPPRRVLVVGIRSATRVRSRGPFAYSAALKIQREMVSNGEYEQVLIMNGVPD